MASESIAKERFFLELEPSEAVMKSWSQVVIVGGGFAGLKAAQRLAGKPVGVTLVDKRNFNLFQPLLYQVASGQVSEADVATPLRLLLAKASNVQVLLGEVVDLDPDAQEVVFNDRRLRYDSLILATGSGTTYLGHEEWRQLAPPMKILEHSDEIRRRMLSALEEAEQTPDPERRRFLQSVVVVGGGPYGCELAGALNDLVQHATSRDFSQLDPEVCQVTLVDPGDRVLRAMAPELSKAAGDYLISRGVELVLGGRVQSMEAGVVSPWPSRIRLRVHRPSGCWRPPPFAGRQGCALSHLGKLLADRSGCTVDRGGRVVVEPDFSIPGHPEIRVVGDLCSY